ncbi:MAG TPA: hypothetical protein VLG72_01400, partial [Nitrospirota bacterium]|nr:hypothetical protein [Nitrospirota bacterium]
ERADKIRFGRIFAFWIKGSVEARKRYWALPINRRTDDKVIDGSCMSSTRLPDRISDASMKK